MIGIIAVGVIIQALIIATIRCGLAILVIFFVLWVIRKTVMFIVNMVYGNTDKNK